MGIFHETTRVFGRAPIPLTIRFDGQDMMVQPGPDNYVPKQAVQFGKNQNPIMGSQDPTNPHISGARYLIADMGDPADAENCVALTKKQWEEHLGRPCRLDEQAMFAERYADDPKARIVVHGKARKPDGSTTSPARNRSEAGGAKRPSDTSTSQAEA